MKFAVELRYNKNKISYFYTAFIHNKITQKDIKKYIFLSKIG